MDLRHLRTFVTVVDAGGIAKAAGRLHLTQPAASRQIMALEEDLGVALFDRIGRRVQLTPHGEELLQRSRRILDEAESLAERARVLKGGRDGTLRVGAPTQTIEAVLAPFAARFRQRYPGIEVHFREATADRLRRHMDRGEVHIGVLPASPGPVEGPLLYPVHVTAVLALSHRLARRRVVEVTELSDEPMLLLGHQFGLRSWFEAACEAAHLRPRVVAESAAPHTLVALAREGFGVAIVPSDMQPHHGDVRLLPVVHRGEPVGRWSGVGWNPRRALPAYAERFATELAAAVKRSHPGRAIARRSPPMPRPEHAR